MAFAGTGSAIGNLIAEDDKENIFFTCWYFDEKYLNASSYNSFKVE